MQPTHALDQIRAGLEQVAPVAGRLVSHRLDDGALLIDDSYNANPGSLAAAIAVLAAARGQRWLVLGDMRELGDGAQGLHARAGEQAKAAGITRLYACGALSAHAADAFGAGGRHFDSHEALVAALTVDLRALDAESARPVTLAILVKGSRGSAMDRVVRDLLEHGDSQ